VWYKLDGLFFLQILREENPGVEIDGKSSCTRGEHNPGVNFNGKSSRTRGAENRDING
jgi:hypothetical protein